jgi:hypothetical protein
MRGINFGLALVAGLGLPLLFGGCTNTTNTSNVTQQQVVVAPGAVGPVLPPGGLYVCALEPKMNAVLATQPITLIFSNQTDGDISLYWLDYNGHRKLYNTIENGKAKGQATFITHPWLITDARGDCIEIVMPGRNTQTVVVQNLANPQSPPTPSSPPAKP